MQTRTLPIAIILFLFAITLNAQTGQQPFADLGKKVKVLTLTNGKYEEFFDDNDIQQIGTALVNIKTMQIVKFQLTKEEQRVIDNSANARFLSVDPLTKNFAMLSPYQYASNSPIRFIDLDGLEATIKQEDNMYFVKLKNVDVSFIVRQSENTFTQSALAKNTNLTDISVNTQQFEPTGAIAWAKYKTAPSSPQPSSDYQAQGFTVDLGKKIAGRTSPDTYYFSQGSANCDWTCGKGDVPKDSYLGFGGGIPMYVNGMKYGETNIYSKDAPAGLPLTGDPGAGNQKYLLQRSNAGYPNQNNSTVGKTVIGYNDKNSEWIVAVQQNGKSGLTLDALRDKLISQGYTSILSFDGSSSSSLIKDDKVLVNPAYYKNNTITTGATFTVPNK